MKIYLQGKQGQGMTDQPTHALTESLDIVEYIDVEQRCLSDRAASLVDLDLYCSHSPPDIFSHGSASGPMGKVNGQSD